MIFSIMRAIQRLGKNVGDDLREGKPTLPLIYVLEHGSDSEKAMVRAAIENGGIDQTHPDFNTILTAITSGGALGVSWRSAKWRRQSQR